MLWVRKSDCSRAAAVSVWIRRPSFMSNLLIEK